MSLTDTTERTPAARPGMTVRIRGVWRAFVASAVVPRRSIVGLLPAAGLPLVAGTIALNLVLGLMPVAFVFATASMIGKVPDAVQGGVGSSAWDTLVVSFVWAAVLFLAQQALTPLQTALGTVMRRRIDGELRDQTMRLVLGTTGIGPMEDKATLDALAEATRQFDSDWHTPGMACSGLLALIARYVRLLAFVIVIGVVASWPAGLSVGAAAMVFRYGQRGGLRKYSSVWGRITTEYRETEYLWGLGVGDGAAKEARVFGLTSWLIDRYRRVYFRMYGIVASERRRIYLRPFLVFTTIGLVLAVTAILIIADLGVRGQIDLTGLALALQAVTAGMMAGTYYIESDVPTQFGMMAVNGLDQVRTRLTAAADADAGGRDPVALDVPRAMLRFEGVSFSYPGSNQMVLDKLDLELPAGLSTAIVGVNGAGKTTLVKLLTRLYEPSSGVVTADGHDIAAFDTDAWRRQVSVIFQDFTRYEFSAADNIAVGAAHTAIDKDRVRRAADRAGITNAFADLPLGLDTTLARSYENGIDLSGGQWQRIAIARSLYALDAGARVLILDEPTAALDVRAEAAFFDQFVELTKGVTSLLISHRFSSVRRADRIVVIDGGKVIEQGSHDQLMQAGGHYARLFSLQAQRFAAGLDAEGRTIVSAKDTAGFALEDLT